MLGDYFRAFWRGMLHHKVATFINVAGLALGLAVFIALTFYVKREFSWDAHWDGAERIYRAAGTQETASGNSPTVITFAPYVLGTQLQSRNPEAFEAYTRVYQLQNNVEYDGEDFPNIGRFHAEPSLLYLVQLETLEGSMLDVFADPRSIAIHETTAKRIFAEQSPLGKLLTFKSQQQGEQDLVIKAVYRVPEPSVLAGMQFLALLEPGALPEPNVSLDLWNQPIPAASTQAVPTAAAPAQRPFNLLHYFKLREGADAKAIESDLRAFMDENKYMEFGTGKTRFTFQNIRDLHLLPGPFDTGDNAQRLWVYAAIGVLVLLISGCNFVMLATLRLVDHMRAVGIRKSLGGKATQLMQQYLLDAFCQTLLAGCVAVGLLSLSLPTLSENLQLPLGVDLLGWRSLAMCFVIVVGFTLLSSLYPAYMMSRGKPALLLRGNSGNLVAGGNALRKLLVGIQFAIVVVLLLASAVVHQQIDYTRNRDRGYSLDNVIAARATTVDSMNRMAPMVSEFSRLPGVSGAAVGGVSPGAVIISPPTQVKVLATDGSTREAGLQQVGVGADYFKVMSVRILAGREFTAEQEGTAAVDAPNAPPAIRNVILNEAALRALGFATPDAAIDQMLETENRNPTGPRVQSMKVIGVVANTQFSSAMLPPVAQIHTYSAINGFLAVKLEPGADVTATTESLKSVWETVLPGSVFTPLDPAQILAFEMRKENFEAKVITGSTGLAMIIALLGLYGLVAATVIKRVKEIGVRKVMGADRSTIVALFLWQFSKPIVVANLIAWPLGFWATTRWLQRFPYQLDMTLVVLSGIAASAVALIIAWLTVGLMAAKAAGTKPVEALRYE